MSTRTASFGPGTTLYGTCLSSSVPSEYFRPMKRLIEKMVCAGLSAAWGLATCPTSRSPVLVKATTEGVIRPPSAFTITVGLSPSIVATAELVVPRSIPIAFAMTLTPCRASCQLAVVFFIVLGERNLTDCAITLRLFRHLALDHHLVLDVEEAGYATSTN